MNALEVDGVWKYYGDFPALRNIGFRSTPGSTVALLGRNGAGKTTLLRIIAGLSRPTKGSVRVLGQDVREESARRRIGVLGHGISLYDELSATENLMLFARLYGFDDPRKTAHEWLERTGLERVSDGLVREFSRGMRQRLAVARAFLHDPEVLLFDEPFTALDDRAIAVLQSLLADAHAQGRTIVMSTHQLREALEIATHVALIRKGQIAYRRRAHARKWSTIPAGCIATTRTTERASLRAKRRRLSGREERPAIRSRCISAGLTIAAKDLRSELRTKEAINASLRVLDGDSGSVQLRVRPVVGTDPRVLGRAAVAGVFVRRRAGAEPQLRAGNAERLPGRACWPRPCPPSALFFGKAFANYALLLAVEFVCLPVFGLFYERPVDSAVLRARRW